MSAAAGSGKTAVLAERCAYLVCDAPARYRCPVKDLLVVTFTEAAAREMRTRIRDRLGDRLSRRPRDDYLVAQVTLVNDAHICTIHAFCLWLIRQRFDRAMIDPDALVLSASEAGGLKSDVLGAVMSERYARDDETGQHFRDLVDAYGLGRDTEIARQVLAVSDLLDTVPDPQAWMGAKDFDAPAKRDAVIGEYAGALVAEIALHVEDASVQAHALSNMEFGGAYATALVEHRSRLLEWHAQLVEAAGADCDGGWPTSIVDQVWSEMDAYRLGAPRIPKGQAELYESASRRFKQCQDRFKSHVRERFVRFQWQELREGLERVGRYWKSMECLVRDFRQGYELEKRRINVIDFADQERLAHRLILQEDIRTSMQSRFAHVLVDEFQDVNRLQADLLQRISREDDGDRAANLFVVGDLKQSIYRFRLAEPRVFQERWRKCGEDESRGTQIHLSENFRSRPAILHAANALFRLLMREEVGEIAYDETAQLQSGGLFSDGSDGSDGPVVDIHWLERDAAFGWRHEQGDEEESEGGDDGVGDGVFVDPDDPAEWTAIEREAYVIASDIHRMRGNGSQVEDGRAVQWSDIVVLLRSQAHTAALLARALERHGVPTSAIGRGRLFESLEIRDIRSLLEVLDNVQQDIPLAAVLRSPILGSRLSDDDLHDIQQLNSQSAFHLNALRYEREGADVELRARLSKAMRRLRSRRRLFRDGPWSQALWNCIERSGYFAYVAGLPGGERRRANILRFLELARPFGDFKQQGLHRFLRFIDAMAARDDDPGVADAGGAPSDAVRIMSIHASKGLEFPVVYVADLGRRFNLRDARGRIILDRDAGMGMKVVDREKMIEYPSATHHLAAQNIERATRAEELRILYVAMTRARERLVLVGSGPLSDVDLLSAGGPLGADGALGQPESPRWPSSLSIATARHVFDWLACALPGMPRGAVAIDPAEMDGRALFHVHFHRLADMQGWRGEKLDDRATRQRFQAIAELQPTTREEGGVEESSSEIEDVIKRIHFDYAYLAASSIRAVVAASESQREAEDRAPLPVRRRQGVDFSGEHDPEVGRRRGTATHELLQHLEFGTEASIQAVQEEIDRLVGMGVLSCEDVLSVELDSIVWLLQTPLAKSIAQAADEYRREFMFVSGQPASFFDDTLEAGYDERVLVRGVVDGVLSAGDGIEIIDFKTDRVEAGDVAAHAQLYERQIQLYAASVAPMFQKPVRRCHLVFLNPRRIVEMAPRSNREP